MHLVLALKANIVSTDPFDGQKPEYFLSEEEDERVYERTLLK
jgi:hypothetical protein